ncbi:NAD(P)/FAD-dependent oxidoreductase [Nesterenkonia sp. F]|uniref:protoporphyrinogen/coproporphyrinogen oxidase n=1 Tax=Nesterenkonia sp. F TaxID=795955 RepID=UPI000255D7A3|nr:FAD-dependent oxidoreductase [Nesterenkonia sp. F]
MSRTLIVGGGIAGLTAAWDLAGADRAVTLVESADRLGGAVGVHHLAGLAVDAGAEAFATRSTAVPRLVEELGLQSAIVEPRPDGAWLRLPDVAAPMPPTGILGIPADPHGEEVVRLIGAEAAALAAQDLTADVAAWRGREGVTLGEVVRDRMGEAVLERLVTPIVSGVHSARADDLDLETAAPGLFAAMLREGSLARAVAAVKAQAPAGSAVQSLHGGLNTLIAAFAEQLPRRGARGVDVRLGRRVDSLPVLLTELAEEDAGPVTDVVLAVDAPTAARLAGGLVELPDAGEHDGDDGRTGGRQADGDDGRDAPRAGRGVALVSMVLDAPELDGRPRGTGMLVAPSTPGVAAKAMTHASAKWEWLDAACGPGRHLVRLSYGRVTDVPGSGVLGFASSDEELLAAAAVDVGALFDRSIAAEQILDADVVRWQKALPRSAAGQAGQIERLRAGLREAPADPAAGLPRLHAAGSWFAGTGLARVVPDARAVAGEILAT